jgi:hypothetical protein
MGMMLGAALAAIPFAILHHRGCTQLALTVGAGACFLLHGQTPFHGRPGVANASTSSSDYRQ